MTKPIKSQLLLLSIAQDAGAARTLAGALAARDVLAAVLVVDDNRKSLAAAEAAMAISPLVVIVWPAPKNQARATGLFEIAERARDRGALSAVRLTKDLPPVGFSGVRTFDLSRKSVPPRAERLDELAEHCRASSDAPAGGGGLKRRWRRVAIICGSLGGFVLAAFSVTGLDLLNVQQQICSIPTPEVISDSCGLMGLGDRPTRKERLNWQAMRPGNCADLRTHMERFPDGKLLARADALYSARVPYKTDRWTSSTQSFALAASAAPSELAAGVAEARRLTQLRAQREAKSICELYVGDSGLRLVSATPTADDWRCDRLGCRVEGHAVCVVETEVVEDKCPVASAA